MRCHFLTSVFFILSGIGGNLAAQYNFNVKRTFGETNHQIVYASYSNDGSYIVTAGSDSSLIVWNTERNTIYRTLSGLGSRPNVAAFSIDNQYVLAGGKDNMVSMWDLDVMPPGIERTFEGHSDQVKSIDVSPDGSLMASGSADGSVMLWNMRNASLVYELKGHSNGVNTVAFSPDGRIVASGGEDGVIVLWNVMNGSKVLSQKAHRGWVRDIVFSHSGDLLASCGDDKLINTWRIPGLEKSAIFKGHKDWIESIDFSPDDQSLISGGRDRLILLWDVSTQQVILQSEKQAQVVMTVDISPVKPDFISSCYGSELLETWVMSGLDETQWNGSGKHIAQVESPQVSLQLEEDHQSPGDDTDPVDPMIELYAPVANNGKAVHGEKSITMIGRAIDPEGISIFLINRAPVTLSETGIFQHNLELNRGENHIALVTVNNKGRMEELNLVIECTAENALVQADEEPDISKGAYYALLIGINDYVDPDIADLDNPIDDAEKLYSVLLSKYTFEKENIEFLKNPTQDMLISTLDKFTRKLKSNDNLLIFYAGHGYWDEKGRVGYWFPSDASRNSTVNWFRNSTLRDFIGSIETRHTLLIADACFSGAIFKSRAAFTNTPAGIEKLYNLTSRKAMTSGIVQEVPDESVFLKYLVKRLEENEEKFLTSEFLFSSFKTPVMNNSANVPQFGVIQNVGDEGGDFVFIRR